VLRCMYDRSLGTTCTYVTACNRLGGENASAALIDIDAGDGENCVHGCHINGYNPGGNAAGQIGRFLEPCLLMLLHDRDTHGYDLANRLAGCGFRQHPLDPSVVYRCLRAMEQRRLVTSAWDTETAAGPPRRVYCLTEVGDRCLANWVVYLTDTGLVIQHFLAAYDEHMQKGPGAHHAGVRGAQGT
jgi:PadR family transcriptional regulator, regulatory protein PadR